MFLCLFQSRIKCWIVPFGTSCCWKVPLVSVGPDGAELLICGCPSMITSAILQDHIEKEPNLQLEQLCKAPQ